MKKKFHMTFGLKMILLAIGMCVAISAAALFSGYLTFFAWNISSYVSSADNLLMILQSEVPVEVLDHYGQQLDLNDPAASQAAFEPDDQYNATVEFLIDMMRDSDVRDIYIARVQADTGLVILFDAYNDSPYYTQKGYSAFGTTYNSPDIEMNLDEMAQAVFRGDIIDDQDNVLTVYLPYLRQGQYPSGYLAMADFSLESVMGTQRGFTLVTSVLLGFLAVIFLIIYLLVIRRSFILPLKSITRAARECGEGAGPEAFDGLELKGSYELQTLSDNFRNMLLEIRENSKRQQDLAVREQALKSEMDLANDLNIAVLPKQLPQREEEYPFRVQGRIDRGDDLNCCFYDYFLLPGDRLCVMVGKIPGGGVPHALFTVMAQAAIKSRLMSELPLMETMTSANRQLYEVGRDMSLSVLVGILDGETGSFSFVNAGTGAPMLMRSQGRYEPLDAPSYALLGQNENVVYRVHEVKLEQGDRLLFHSEDVDSGLGTGANVALCRAMNETGVRSGGLDAQLAALENAFGKERNAGRAMLALEFCRRDKAKAHCLITPDAAGATQLQHFIKEQMRANGIDDLHMAQLAVLGDELFALCRSGADRDGRFMAECAVRQDAVALRIRGDMGGRDPMSGRAEGPESRAVEYIRRSCERVTFERDGFTDTVTLLKRLT